MPGDVRIYRILSEPDGEGWFARLEEIEACHTQGATAKEAADRLCEAVLLFEEEGRVGFYRRFGEAHLLATVPRTKAKAKAAAEVRHLIEAERAMKARARELGQPDA
ncbi:MAG TPA: hypothetical protein VGI39_03255 [Polyangiaceae bacterium]|jgi:predicted RNase H-like HicB family nuclease